MELKRNLNEVMAIFKEPEHTYKIGLGFDSLTKTDNELKIIAQQKYDEIKFREANPPLPTVQELRLKEYIAKGITIDKMLVALWELVVEKRPEASNLIQIDREAVKTKYPKV